MTPADLDDLSVPLERRTGGCFVWKVLTASELLSPGENGLTDSKGIKDQGLSRRGFLRSSAGLALTAAAGGALGATGRAPAILTVRNPNSKLQVAIVGLGGISRGHVAGVSREEHLVALCEVEDSRMERTIGQIKDLERTNVKARDMERFVDYREMLDAMGDRLDAVIVCTPDHNHACIGMAAIRSGKHTFIEKPMAHNIHEAYALQEAARKHRVATQMGNEGHSGEGYRRLCEYIWAGAIGPVTQVYHWCGRSFGGEDRELHPVPVREGFNWELWSAPVPQPADVPPGHHIPAGNWRANRKYGTGNLGDWGCHTMDGAYWALKIDRAPTWHIECLERLYGGTQQYYRTNTFKWTIPARADMPPLTSYWFDGIKPNPDPTGTDADGNPVEHIQNMPQLVEQIEAAYGRDFGQFGTIYVGEKGYMFSGGTGGGVRVIPESLHRSIEPPPQTIPRAEGHNRAEWFHAIRTGEPSSASFEYSSGLTEYVLSGILAMNAGPGRVVEYDHANRRVADPPELNEHISREYREGFEV